MDITLKVTPEKLEQQASVVERQARDLENEFNRMQDEVARTTGYWVGIAGDKARKEFDAQKDDMATILKRFREHPTDLLKMAGIYKEAENTNEESNKSLNTDIVV